MVCEPSLTVHLFVGFRHAAVRIILDHRVHAGQRTEFQCVLRIVMHSAGSFINSPGLR